MNSTKQDDNGLRAAFAIVCECEDLAARLRISLISTSSGGLIIEALMGGYLKKTKKLLLLKLILFSLKSATKRVFGIWLNLFSKTKLSNVSLKKIKF